MRRKGDQQLPVDPDPPKPPTPPTGGNLKKKSKCKTKKK